MLEIQRYPKQGGGTQFGLKSKKSGGDGGRRREKVGTKAKLNSKDNHDSIV